MHEHNQLAQMNALDMIRERQQIASRLRRPHRRTTRRTVATGLHRLADRLDTRDSEPLA